LLLFVLVVVVVSSTPKFQVRAVPFSVTGTFVLVSIQSKFNSNDLAALEYIMDKVHLSDSSSISTARKEENENENDESTDTTPNIITGGTRNPNASHSSDANTSLSASSYAFLNALLQHGSTTYDEEKIEDDSTQDDKFLVTSSMFNEEGLGDQDFDDVDDDDEDEEKAHDLEIIRITKPIFDNPMSLINLNADLDEFLAAKRISDVSILFIYNNTKNKYFVLGC
jgi:hypothetical protein